MNDRDAPLAELDDHEDREELRRRYVNLLQELRVVLPGVQVLLAFMLTVPFGNRFDDLDAAGRNAFTAGLVMALASVVCLLTPAVFHRVAERTARTARLEWGVRLAVVGMWLLAAALLTSLWCVVRFIHSPALAAVLTAGGVVLVLSLWLAIPLAVGRPRVGGSGGADGGDQTTSK